MAHSYTPGLKVARFTLLRRERKLPLAGDVLVTVGQKVEAETCVARTELPGNVQTVNAASMCPKSSATVYRRRSPPSTESPARIAST